MDNNSYRRFKRCIVNTQQRTDIIYIYPATDHESLMAITLVITRIILRMKPDNSNTQIYIIYMQNKKDEKYLNKSFFKNLN